MRYFIELSYNGKNYHGWQIQPNAITVQQTINDILSTLLKQDISIVGAGRTDTGVHAEVMFAHFDTDTEIDSQELCRRMNAFLPEDIAISNIFKVDADVHARFDAVSRSYEYRIWLGRNPFLIDTTWQLYNVQLDIDKMNRAAAIMKEYTDFQCFSKSKTDVKTYNCSIEDAVWKQNGQLLVFYITADRFLRNMVRAIVGTLIDIGMGKTTEEDLRAIIKSKKRSLAGPSVPAHGLFLKAIQYPDRILMNQTNDG